MKKIIITGLATLMAVFFFNTSFSADPPHSDTSVPKVSCGSSSGSGCHKFHNAPGASLTAVNGNVNLCQSCHTSGGAASSKPMPDSEMATTSSGRSHRWDRSLAAGVAPLNLVAGSSGNAYGLRTAAEIADPELKLMLQSFNNTVVCSVCHDQHNHSKTAWDPFSSSVYTSGTTSDRHFMRMSNDINQLCEDCHYYRAMTYSRARGDDGSYPGNGTNVFSHPVGETLNALGYDRTAPLDYNGAAHQTAPRYYTSGTGDTNNTNNVTLDSSSKVRCMSCHRMHYVDSSGETVDTP